ncbi:hypothetical protein ACN47E_005591 [Coniothyrium glycines]
MRLTHLAPLLPLLPRATALALPGILTSTPTPADTAHPAVQCGHLAIVEGGFLVPMYTSNLCTSADVAEHFKLVDNWACGLCIVFMGRDCQGDIKYWGGPEARSRDVTGAQSYWCY